MLCLLSNSIKDPWDRDVWFWPLNSYAQIATLKIIAPAYQSKSIMQPMELHNPVFISTNPFPITLNTPIDTAVVRFTGAQDPNWSGPDHTTRRKIQWLCFLWSFNHLLWNIIILKVNHRTIWAHFPKPYEQFPHEIHILAWFSQIFPLKSTFTDDCLTFSHEISGTFPVLPHHNCVVFHTQKQVTWVTPRWRLVPYSWPENYVMWGPLLLGEKKRRKTIGTSWLDNTDFMGFTADLW